MSHLKTILKNSIFDGEKKKNLLFPFFCWIGVHRNSQEKAGVLEAAGPQAAALVSPQSDAGHASVPTERVRLTALF